MKSILTRAIIGINAIDASGVICTIVVRTLVNVKFTIPSGETLNARAGIVEMQLRAARSVLTGIRFAFLSVDLALPSFKSWKAGAVKHVIAYVTYLTLISRKIHAR